MAAALIGNGVSLVDRAAHQVGPSLGVPAENEKGGLYTALAEGIQNRRRCVGIRPIIEREGDYAIGRPKMRDRTAEQEAVSVKGAVRQAANHGGRKRGTEHHATTATRPSTDW